MHERRRFKRYLFGVPAKLSGPETPAPLHLIVVNIGLNGCSVEGAGGLKVGQKCRLEVEWRSQQMVLDALVVWQDERGFTGFVFSAVEPKSLDQLRELCSTLKVQPRV